MATQQDSTTEQEHDGPALVMSVLYEANDLLNVLRDHVGETVTIGGRELSGRVAAQTTLSGEVSSRINRAIALLDAAVPAYDDEKPEAATGIADSLATDEDEDEDQPEPLELHVISDRLQDRIRWAHGVLDMVICEPDNNIAQPIADAASGAAHYLREALECVRSLDRWRWEHNPVEARDLTNANQREDEKRDLVRQLLPLSHDDANEVMMTHMAIAQLDDRDEGLRLLEKYPLSYVHRFLYMQKQESKRENAQSAE